jgi:hypothetical protein
LNCEQLSLIELTYSLTDISVMKPLESCDVVLVSAFHSGNVALVVQRDLDTLCVVTRALTFLADKPGLQHG